MQQLLKIWKLFVRCFLNTLGIELQLFPCLQSLIAQGVDVDAKDAVSITPLHFAAERDSIGAAKVPCFSFPDFV